MKIKELNGLKVKSLHPGGTHLGDGHYVHPDGYGRATAWVDDIVKK